MANYREEVSADLLDTRKPQEINSGLATQETIDTPARQSVQEALDQTYPNVEHRQIVEYQGKRYRCRYFPEKKARSGWAVTKWGRRWELLDV